jgi:hypothetical protein
MARPSLVLAGAAGAAAVVASVVVPRVREVSTPDLVDVAVPITLIGCSLRLADRGRRWPAALLGGAGMLWCAVGLTPAMPERVGNGLVRLGVFPLALLVVVVATLPGAAPRVVRVVAGLALAVAACAGAGLTQHVRLSLGAILVLAAGYSLVSRGHRTHSGFRMPSVILPAALGAVLVAVDPIMSGALVRPAVAADTVGLAMAVGAVGVLQVLDPERLVWGSSRASAVRGDRLGVESWLADLLAAPGLRIAYPTAQGGHVLEDGEPCAPPDGPPMLDTSGKAVAWFDRHVAVDPAMRTPLLRLLATVGASAHLRSLQRNHSAALAHSRARLADSALGESVALERRLAQSVLPRLDAIAGRAALLPNADVVSARVDAARDQVIAVSRGLSPIGDRRLADTLGDLALLAPERVSVDVTAIGNPDAIAAPDVAEATAMWFAASEAVANALKHAGGSPVHVRAIGPCELEILDRGAGGADAAGSGLAGIGDRLAAVGGRLHVVSGADGTRVSISVRGRIRAVTYPDLRLAATTRLASDSYLA